MTLLTSSLRGDKCVVFDSETHNKVDPRIIESAYGYVNDKTGAMDIDSIVVERFNPGVPIDFGAMATHHILDEDLVNYPSSDTFSLPADVGYVIGHNVEFDMGAAGISEGYRTIDTLVLARRAWPEATSHTQTALFYRLHAEHGLDLTGARSIVQSAHSAEVDIQICSFILNQLITDLHQELKEIDEFLGKELSLFEGLHILTQVTQIPMEMEFGKHIGTPPHKVPRDYKEWYQRTDAPNPLLLLAMNEGGSTPEGKALYALSKHLFSLKKEADSRREDVAPSTGQSSNRFSFGR